MNHGREDTIGDYDKTGYGFGDYITMGRISCSSYDYWWEITPEMGFDKGAGTAYGGGRRNCTGDDGRF